LAVDEQRSKWSRSALVSAEALGCIRWNRWRRKALAVA
jgi:hypothetical protein